MGNYKTIRLRKIYIFAAIITVFTGICARVLRALLPEGINLWLGDFLYAVMMYFIVSAMVTGKSAVLRAVIAVIICYAIEISQLYQAEWINAVRATLPGRLVLGNGFLWSDLVAYAAGVAVVFCIDVFWSKPKKSTA